MSALTIVNPLAGQAVLIALPMEVIDQRDDLLLRSATLQVTDEATYREANALYKAIRGLSTLIEGKRKEITAPILALKAALDAAAKEGTDPLEAQRAELGRKIAAFEAEENKRRAEEAKRIEAERQRLQAEADRIAAEQHAAAVAAAAEDAHCMPGEVPEPPAATEYLPVRVDLPVAPPAMLKGAVKRTTSYSVAIDDVAKIPVEINGVRLLVPDERAILTLLRAGMVIPGVRLLATEGVGAKGTR